ncbi:MAG TPA: D-cysteine desulfhydrase family protein [Candidatus Acidoferrales bacterium]|jgi:L-cysteate sulfo-lyase|nr:D-cysteine desulfhydrase family protein [Candidatus Acidoferrales bacterium]
MRIDSLPRHPLAHLPTPLEELPALTRQLAGPKLLIKRDDQTGLALGGNKTRKLEFLLGDALAKDADTLITLGAVQSNHCRQTAAAAAKAGLRCELILNGKQPDLASGNLLLDEILGANLHWIDRSQRAAKLKELDAQLRAQGRKPYLIPVGGSNGVGATGYVVAMQELMAQLTATGRHVDHLLFGTSSGGTQAGIVLGARLAGFTGRLHGLSIDKNDPEHFEYETEVAQIANDCAAYIGSPVRVSRDDIKVVYGYKGEGYGVVGDLERDAIRLLARSEGIVLDPVYAGRAFGALVDLIRKGTFKKDETVLFWHTGGAPALFAYAQELL